VEQAIPNCLSKLTCLLWFQLVIEWKEYSIRVSIFRRKILDCTELACVSTLRSQVAAALDVLGFAKGDAIAVDMPMTIWSIIIYLGIVLSGRVVVSIADSFAASEVKTRLTISKAKGIFTQVCFLINSLKMHTS
jgi:hypothetical protein